MNTALVERAVYGVAAAWLAVIVVAPAPIIVTAPVEELMVATSVLELLKVNRPLLGELGWTMLNVASPKVLEDAIKAPKVGEAGSTTNVVRMVDVV